MGVLVASCVQLGGLKLGVACKVTRKYGEVSRTTIAELVPVMEMEVKKGAGGGGKLPLLPS